MLEVILVRHAIAFEPDSRRWPDDAARPLTAEGIEKFRKSAAGLELLIERPDKLFTSPFLRTRQTAQLLTEVAGWPAAEESEALATWGTSAQMLDLLNKQSDGRIALVSHEPNLSQFAAMALAGERNEVSIEMRKGSVLCLEFMGTVRPGNATLIALLPPSR